MIQPVKEKIILGIDPGTTIMGYGLLKVVGTKPQVMTMGVIDLRKYGDHYLKLRRIFERVVGIIEAYLPDELAIEAPFLEKCAVDVKIRAGTGGGYGCCFEP